MRGVASFGAYYIIYIYIMSLYPRLQETDNLR